MRFSESHLIIKSSRTIEFNFSHFALSQVFYSIKPNLLQDWPQRTPGVKVLKKSYKNGWLVLHIEGIRKINIKHCELWTRSNRQLVSPIYLISKFLVIYIEREWIERWNCSKSFVQPRCNMSQISYINASVGFAMAFL